MWVMALQNGLTFIHKAKHQQAPICAASLLRVKWNADGSCLASASDDRTVRIWRLYEVPAYDQQGPQHAQQAQHADLGDAKSFKKQGQQAEQAPPSQHPAQQAKHAQQAQQEAAACLQPVHVLYGHAGRLWDCHFGHRLLVTASEDCTARQVLSAGMQFDAVFYASPHL